MKLDVSDVLYDSSSVSSDSGASQSSRVSHDFLTSIANTAVLPNNVSTRVEHAPTSPAPRFRGARTAPEGPRDAWTIATARQSRVRALYNARATMMR